MSINRTMTALADEVRELSGKTGKLTLENMTDEVASGNGTISDQTDLIAQIAQALEGKAAGGGVCAPATISGVNLHDTTADTPNTYLQGSTLKAYNGWATTDFIPVEDGKFYLAYSTSTIDTKYCSKFNENKGGATSLSGVINCTNKNRPVFLLGHNGYYRFSGTTSQINALEFYEVVNFHWEVT
jgi:hypothetical protein